MGNRHPGSRSRVPECQPATVRLASTDCHHQIRCPQIQNSNRTGSAHRHDQRPGSQERCRSGRKRGVLQCQDGAPLDFRPTRGQGLWRNDAGRCLPHHRCHHDRPQPNRDSPLRLHLGQETEKEIQKHTYRRAVAVERRRTANGSDLRDQQHPGCQGWQLLQLRRAAGLLQTSPAGLYRHHERPSGDDGGCRRPVQGESRRHVYRRTLVSGQATGLDRRP